VIKLTVIVWKGRLLLLVMGRGSGWMSVYFVHLAGCAFFNISSDKVFHVWPPVMRLYQLDGFHDSRVSSSFRSVKMVK